VNVPLLVYCVKLLTYCLPTLAYARLLPPLGAFIRVAYLNHGLLLLSLSDVAAARCAAHLLSTDVYAKCHILYLSCLNCSSLFLYFYTMAAAAAPPSLPAADPLSFSTSRHFTIFFVEFLIMHTRWSHIYLKAALFFTLCLLF